MSLTIKPTLNQRVFEHTLAGLTTAAPINAGIVFLTSAALSDPIFIAIITTILATAVSAIRTYYVLRSQDARSSI
jgi:hypothetical protein